MNPRMLRTILPALILFLQCMLPAAESRNVSVVNEYQTFLDAGPGLWREGGRRFRDGNGWVAVGVGMERVAVPGGEPAYTDWRGAAYRADRFLLEAVGHSTISATKRMDADRSGVRYRSVTTIETDGTLSAVREVGRWTSENGAYCHVMRVAFSPGHPIGRIKRATGAARVELPPPWREAFLSRPTLVHGGVETAVVDGLPRLLVSIGQTLPPNAGPRDVVQASRRADTLAHLKANAFLEGMRISGRDEATASWDDMAGGGHAPTAAVSRRVQVGMAGTVAGLRTVGDWRSEDGGTFVKAYVMDLPMR